MFTSAEIDRIVADPVRVRAAVRSAFFLKSWDKATSANAASEEAERLLTAALNSARTALKGLSPK